MAVFGHFWPFSSILLSENFIKQWILDRTMTSSIVLSSWSVDSAEMFASEELILALDLLSELSKALTSFPSTGVEWAGERKKGLWLPHDTLYDEVWLKLVCETSQLCKLQDLTVRSLRQLSPGRPGKVLFLAEMLSYSAHEIVFLNCLSKSIKLDLKLPLQTKLSIGCSGLFNFIYLFTVFQNALLGWKA